MTAPLRWGVAGTGAIAQAMARTLTAYDGAELVAVGSRTLDAATAFAGAHGDLRAHGSYADLAGDAEVDVVYVATPHSHHHEHTVAALRAGRHVLCEKPLARNAAEAEDMAAVAREHDRFLMEAMWTWFNPAIVELTRRIRSGAIGEVRAVRADFGLRVDGTTGRLHDPALAGGSLLDMGIYPVALMHLLLGAPTEVNAVGEIGPTGVDRNVGAVLAHVGGAVGTFHTSLQTRTSWTAEVTGTEGRIRIPAPFWEPHGFEVVHDDEVETVALPHAGLLHEVEHLTRCIREGRVESPVLPLETSISMMATLDALRRRIGLRYPGES